MSNEDRTIEQSFGERVFRPMASVLFGIFEYLEGDRTYYDVSVKVGETDKVRKFMHAAFYYRTRWQFVLIGVLISMILADIYQINPGRFNLQIYGLIFDIFGTIFLVLGLVRGVTGVERDANTKFIGGHSGSTEWYYSSSLSAVARNTVDGFWGALYLFVGFSLQIISISGFA